MRCSFRVGRMTTTTTSTSTTRTTSRSRWAAVGAAVAVSLGAGGIGLVSATSPADATTYIPIEPCRLADTRPQAEFNTGPHSSPIGPAETRTLAAHGSNGDCTGIPTDATGLQANVTSLNASTGTFLALWGEGARPDVSHLNPQPGQPPIPNAVTVGLAGDGTFRLFNAAGSVDYLIDIVGYYADHHHDDRYYTKAESDAAYVGEADVMWARVAGSGSIVASSPGITVANFAESADGRYLVDFPVGVTSCAIQLTMNTSSGDVATGVVGPYLLEPTSERVFVYIENEAGDRSARDFSLTAHC